MDSVMISALIAAECTARALAKFLSVAKPMPRVRDRPSSLTSLARTTARNHCLRTRPLTRLASLKSSAKPVSKRSSTASSGSETCERSGPQGMAATKTKLVGSGNSTVTRGQRFETSVVSCSKSLGSTSCLVSLLSGSWNHDRKSSKGSWSKAATHSRAHSFSLSFFFAVMRDSAQIKPNSSPPPVLELALVTMSNVTLGELATLRGGSMPSSQIAAQL
mmetsp:Transcript_31780/g.62455  ORF Transcript_31780/g.62455 Transcript_31780/m.62455 type:complete len:219 (+) Transcript_31780:357-1013(+)